MPQTKAPAPHNFANIAHSGPDLEGVVLDILHLVCLALIISDLLKYHCEEASQHPILLGGSVQLMPALEARAQVSVQLVQVFPLRDVILILLLFLTSHFYML